MSNRNHKRDWDDFVRTAKNGTFLFYRDYMDYHSDRFEDHSLMIYSDDGNVVCLLPANKQGEVFTSHAGLTYGGFITDNKMTISKMGEVFNHTVQYLLKAGFAQLLYKTIPHIYHAMPAEEDLYWLFVNNATLYRRDVWVSIEYNNQLLFQKRRERSIKKAISNGVIVEETQDYDQYWAILEKNLQSKYNVAPVHTVQEIRLLADRFPEEIKLVVAYQGTTLLAGTVLYLSHNVCHTQYLASNEVGRAIGALDLVLSHLIKDYRKSKEVFSFGAVTELNGRYLNAGLSEYKESFGGRATVHNFYELDFKGKSNKQSEK
ncbi:MAG: GNAT family N-acetyltransferase [Abitibacteriaceae bacterium]|nr:GNAT family N-acetyltransferase [Abditibacteriaceae bacterium]